MVAHQGPLVKKFLYKLLDMKNFKEYVNECGMSLMIARIYDWWHGGCCSPVPWGRPKEGEVWYDNLAQARVDEIFSMTFLQTL